MFSKPCSLVFGQVEMLDQQFTEVIFLSCLPVFIICSLKLRALVNSEMDIVRLSCLTPSIINLIIFKVAIAVTQLSHVPQFIMGRVEDTLHNMPERLILVLNRKDPAKEFRGESHLPFLQPCRDQEINALGIFVPGIVNHILSQEMVP